MKLTTTHYNSRNEKKKYISFRAFQEKYISPREIRFTYYGLNIWFEQNGDMSNFLRPVLVIKKVGWMYYSIPLTTKWKESPLVFELHRKVNKAEKSFVLLWHAKIMDWKRFIDKIWTINESDFEKIKKLLIKYYF